METKSFSCPSCGGKLFYNPKMKVLSCEACKNNYFPNEIMNYDKNLDVDIEIVADHFSQEDNTNMYTCSSCGGQIIALDSIVSTACPFCGNNVLIKSSLVGSYRPKYVVPFSKNKEEAKGLLNQYLNKSILLSKKTKSELKQEGLNDIYIPIYLVKGKACFDFSKIERGNVSDIFKNSEDRIPTVQITMYGKVNFSKLPVDGLKDLDNDLVESVSPFEINDLKPFETPYLAGHLAKRFDISFNHLEDAVAIRVKDDIYNYVKNKEFKMHSEDKSFSYLVSNVEVYNMQATYIFYPMWLLEHSYNGKKICMAINDKNGKIFGILPVSKLRVAGFSLLYFMLFCAILFGIIFVFSRFWIVSLILASILGIILSIVVMFSILKKNYSFKKQFEQYIDPKSYSLSERKDPHIVNKQDIEKEIEYLQKELHEQRKKMRTSMDQLIEEPSYISKLTRLNGLISASRQLYDNKLKEESMKVDTYTKEDLVGLLREVEALKASASSRYNVGLINKEYSDLLQEYCQKRKDLYMSALEKLNGKEE